MVVSLLAAPTLFKPVMTAFAVSRIEAVFFRALPFFYFIRLPFIYQRSLRLNSPIDLCKKEEEERWKEILVGKGFFLLFFGGRVYYPESIQMLPICHCPCCCWWSVSLRILLRSIKQPASELGKRRLIVQEINNCRPYLVPIWVDCDVMRRAAEEERAAGGKGAVSQAGSNP